MIEVIVNSFVFASVRASLFPLTMELRWHSGQAALLATQLEEGQPCPVCGSNEHPAPATSNEEALVSKQEVDAVRMLETKAFEVLQTRKEALAQIDTQLELITSKLITNLNIACLGIQ